VRGRLHVLAVSLSRGRGPWHPSDRGLVGPQSLSEQRYLQQSTTVCSAHIRLRKYEMKEGMLPVSYQLTMPSALDFHLLTACHTNSGSWEIEKAGVLMIDLCAMTACKVEFWRFGKSAARIFGIDGCSWMLKHSPQHNSEASKHLRSYTFSNDLLLLLLLLLL